LDGASHTVLNRSRAVHNFTATRIGGKPAPVAISILVPAAAVYLGLLAFAWRILRTAGEAPSRGARVAAGSLILGSTIVWLAAVAWPGMELVQIAGHRAEHMFASAAFLLGALLTLVGFTVMNALLETAGDRFLSRLGLVSLFLGTVCWTIHLAFRLTIMLSLAKTVRTTEPDWYSPLRMWAGAMYALYMPLSYLAVAAFGGAMRNVGWISKAWGRSFVAFGLMATTGFLARGNIRPTAAGVNFMPYAAGILLLRRNASPAMRLMVTGVLSANLPLPGLWKVCP
jgi:hypothetical protein